MKSIRRVDRVLLIATIFMLSAVFGAMSAEKALINTYAEGENGVYEEQEDHFVTFFDDGEKLTVKTNARTVSDALSKAGYEVGAGDIVEPGLDTEIDMDNFFINIHRARPALVKVGLKEKYVMTASYDAKTIIENAGEIVYDGDEIRVLENQNFLETGIATIYELIRNGGRMVTVETEIPFTEKEVKDYSLAPGQKEVKQLGETGLKTATYEVLYKDGEEVSRTLVTETITREPVEKIVAVGANEIAARPLTAAMGANIYTVTKADGSKVDRKETYYDLPMGLVMQNAARMCGVEASYSVREDGVKVDAEGYVLVAANLSKYPRCSMVETSLGPGKVYDTGGFAAVNSEQFDLATDWTNRDGR